MASAVLEAHIRDGTILLPVRPVLALAGVDSNAIGGERPLAAMEVLLHAAITFDTTALLVQVADSGVLPVSRRASRARARARLATTNVHSTPSRRAAMHPLPSAVSIAYAAQRDGALSIGASLRVVGGIAELATSRASGTGVRTTLSWTSPPSPALGGARLHVGAIDELAGRSGFLLTNAPVAPADTFRLRTLDLRLPPGTELELFEDDVLVGADSVGSDGRARARLAERRGAHDVRMIVYDSVGRTRVVRWAEYLPESLLQRGEFRYMLAARGCSHVVCARPVGQIAYAPADHLTVAVRAAPSGEPGHAREWVAGMSLDARLATSAALEVNGASGGPVAGELRVERPRDGVFVLRAGRVGAAHRVPLPVSSLLPLIVGPADRIVSAEGSWRVGSAGALSAVAARIGANTTVGASASGTSTVGVLRGSVALVGGSVRCTSVGGGALVWGGWLPRPLGAIRSAGLSMRAERRTSGCGDESSGALALLVPALRWSAVELGMSWMRPRGARSRIALSLALRRRIAGVIDAHAELVGGAAAPVVRSGVSGALLLDALHRSVSLADDPAGGTAGVHGVVYVDDNANGRRDAGERVVPDALVRVGEMSAVSDARGVFVVPGLATDRVVRLTVDSASVEDRGYVPDVPIVVMLVSRAMVRVDVPVRAAR